MRCVASVGLLALVGCNQVFGIAQTSAYDAPQDVKSDRTYATLDWQVATVDPATGGPGSVAFMAIDPMPAIRIAALDADPTDPRSWSVPAYGSDGTFDIPKQYVTSAWRLEYTVAGLTHEVQWLPDDKLGHITVPIFGRPKRDPLPTGSGYTITPTPATTFMFPRVFTTGVWSEGPATPTGGTVDYDVSKDVSLSGGPGAPDPTLGDQALLVDYMNDPDTGCRFVIGSALLATPITLQANTRTIPAAPWVGSTGNTGNAISLPIVGNDFSRFVALDSLGGSVDLPSSKRAYGATLSLLMPGLAGAAGASTVESLLLPAPVMVPLVQCPTNMPTEPAVTQPMFLDPFPKILHAQLIFSRMTATLGTFVSGMESVMTTAVGGGYTMAFPAPLVTQIQLTSPAGTQILLDGSDGAMEQIAIGKASGIYTLTFKPETATNLRVDYYDVLVHKIVAANNLTTERIYTVPAPTDASVAPSVRIDGTIFSPGADYVFEIRSFKGHLKAPHGDFSPVDYPYGSAIVFPRTFKAS